MYMKQNLYLEIYLMTQLCVRCVVKGIMEVDVIIKQSLCNCGARPVRTCYFDHTGLWEVEFYLKQVKLQFISWRGSYFWF